MPFLSIVDIANGRISNETIVSLVTMICILEDYYVPLFPPSPSSLSCAILFLSTLPQWRLFQDSDLCHFLLESLQLLYIFLEGTMWYYLVMFSLLFTVTYIIVSEELLNNILVCFPHYFCLNWNVLMIDHNYLYAKYNFQYFYTHLSVVSCKYLLLNLWDCWINVISL